MLEFDIRVLCRMHERRRGINGSVVNLDSLSLSSLHWQHCIRSILLRVADTSKIHPFQHSSEIWNVGRCTTWMSLVDCAQNRQNMLWSFMSHFKVFGSYGSLFWTGMALRNCGEKLQPASTASSWADHRQLVLFASCIQDDRQTFQLDFKAKPFDKVDMIQSYSLYIV